MNKKDFLWQLRNGLNGLPQEEIEERITFYSEMIDDRMEEGLSEEEAVGGIGPVEQIVSQVVGDIPLTKYIKDKITPKKKLSTLEIVLLVLGSPIWFSLLITLASVVFTLYMSLWAVVIAMWAVFVAFVACSISGIIAGIGFTFCEHGPTGIAVIGASFVLAGLAIYLSFGCKAATNAAITIVKKLILWIKRRFIKKEEL